MSEFLREVNPLPCVGSSGGDLGSAPPASGQDTGDPGEAARAELTYRRQVRDRLAVQLRSESDRMRQMNRSYYEGAWLTMREIRARRRARRRREWAQLLELIILLLALSGGAFALYKILRLIG